MCALGRRSKTSHRTPEMSKDEIITAVAVTTDKALLARVADVLSHREDTSPSKGERETRLITQAEAAKRLGVSTTTVWRLIKEGSLSVIPVRGKQRVRLASLTQYALGEADHV